MFLHSFNYFRGISIVFIVAGHTFWVARWNIDTLWERTIANLLAGGTILFVFISGFLFHHVFYPKFSWQPFMQKKLQNVLLPYLLLSAIPISWFVFFNSQEAPMADYIFTSGEGLWAETIRPILLYLWTGAAVPPYWYIVFILLTYSLSPLHVAFINTTPTKRMLVLAVLITLSIMLQRPPYNLSPIHALFYYASVYFLGIYCSMHRDIIYAKLNNREFYLLIPIIALAVLQAWKFPWSSLLAKSPFDLGFPDTQYIQKLLLCLFFMVFLHRFEDRHLLPLTHLAQASFAIYFLHSFLIEGLGITLKTLGFDFSGNIFTWLGVTVFIIWFSYELARILKHWLGKNSRYFIGW